MALHVLEREQLLSTTLPEAWAFFSTPRNLARITPPELGFRIEEPFDDAPAHTGQLISYTVRPLLGIPMRWVTRIDDVSPPHRFIDSQLKGPYAVWRHTHTFLAVADGVLMKDRVEYRLPFGPLGEALHAPLIKPRLERIFAYRTEVLAKLFPAAIRTEQETQTL